MNAGRPQKASMNVAQQIAQEIMTQRLQAGDRLPSEKQMLEDYAIGRGTLREALRLLEFQGVIRLKPGPGGGPVVCLPDAEHLANTLRLLMQLHHATYEVVLQARTTLEPVISELAATRISPTDVESLRTTVDVMGANLDDRYRFLDANRDFHGIIARSSGNVLFGYMIESLLGILDGSVMGIEYTQNRRQAVFSAHQNIFEALAAGDATESFERMRRHVEEHEVHARTKFPEVLDQVITWDRFT